MTLGEIFGNGHRVATCFGPQRFVVRCPNPPAPDGYWLVRPSSVPAIMVRRQVELDDLAGSLSGMAMRGHHWQPDLEHCWCEICTNSRRCLETQGD